VFGIKEANMLGIHHVTAIAGDPVKNLSFYTRDLGLRFVKKTVNFDDPSTYHFYYGDETGSPGTILTFFPWTNAPAGRRGVGETRQTAFRVPLRSIGYWTQRFIEKGILHQKLEKRFGQSVLPFTDQDGMELALVGIADAENEPGWSNEDIPSEHAIRGFQGVTLLLDSAQKTAAILTDVFGFREVAREGSVIRFAAAGDVKGNVVDICEAAGVQRGHQGRGSVHHIAFRAVDDVQQAQMTEKLIRTHGRHPTEQMLQVSRASAQRLVSLCLAERLITFGLEHQIAACMEVRRAPGGLRITGRSSLFVARVHELSTWSRRA
jgi:glyoxalase family protein